VRSECTCARARARVCVCVCVCVCVWRYRATPTQLSDGFKSGLADAMDKYGTEQNKKDAVDGIQSFVCRLLFLSLVLHNCVWPLRRMRRIYFSVKNKFFFFFFYIRNVHKGG